MHADMGDFGVAISTPRYRHPAGAPTPAGKGILDGHAPRGLGDVGEFVRHADIARRVDAAVRRSQEVIDDDSLRSVGRDARGVEVQSRVTLRCRY